MALMAAERLPEYPAQGTNASGPPAPPLGTDYRPLLKSLISALGPKLGISPRPHFSLENFLLLPIIRPRLSQP